MKKIGVLGAGTWGIALAITLYNNGHKVMVWSAIENEIDELVSSRRHPKLAEIVIPDGLIFTKSLEEVCKEKDILVLAVPSIFVRDIMKSIKNYIKNEYVIVNVAKGIELGTLFTLSQVISDELSDNNLFDNIKVVTLSGPTHAEEVAKSLPTTIVSACDDTDIAKYVQDIFMNSFFRVYTNKDIIGVEIGGSLKNIIAIAVGISNGLGYGDNAKSALIARGIAEISRLGIAMGCNSNTFNGLSGLGDLVVTCTSIYSRNNRAGEFIGRGFSKEEAIRNIGMTVEGIYAIDSAIELSKKYDIELPIINTVNEIVNNRINPNEAINYLMTRECEMEY